MNVRRGADIAIPDVHPFVRPSVWHMLISCQNGYTYRRFFTAWYRHYSTFVTAITLINAPEYPRRAWLAFEALRIQDTSDLQFGVEVSWTFRHYCGAAEMSPVRSFSIASAGNGCMAWVTHERAGNCSKDLRERVGLSCIVDFSD